MDANLQALIGDYLKLARAACKVLSEQAKTPNILKAVNCGGFPREGRFPGYGGGTYFVHGSGCEVCATELEIDFDFGPKGQIPGFDPWKLYDFARSHADAYPWLPDRAAFNNLVNSYVERRVLKRIETYPSPHLLCISAGPW